MKLPLRTVDVFTQVPFLGNPVAVVLDADDISSEQMQTIARWTNLSETTFVLRPTLPEASYRLRIFTPRAELPFAGHPTIGSAHAILEHGMIRPNEGRLVQECGVGLVQLRVDAGSGAAPGMIRLQMPKFEASAVSIDERSEIEALFGCKTTSVPAIIDLGPRWLCGEVASIAALRGLDVDFVGLKALSGRWSLTGASVFAREGERFEVRSFAPAHGIDEDPVCGSGNGAVAYFLSTLGETSSYIARQGYNVGRDGHVHIEFEGQEVLLGGHCVTCIEGTLQR